MTALLERIRHRLDVARASRGPTSWPEFLDLRRRYLNLGAYHDRHPKTEYRHYVAVTVPPSFFQYRLMNATTGMVETNADAVDQSVFPPSPPWVIFHDIRTPFPLPDDSVDRLHSEDCFEHLERSEYLPVLAELHRILKPGGRFRLAVPDYHNPKDAFCIDKGFDPRDLRHLTITTYELMEETLAQSKFDRRIYYHYWKDGAFVRNPIDYSLGHVARTPDNDHRNTPDKPLHVTSLVVDLIKAG
jgi:predicted SAM-dependent methyltransferase